MSPFPWIFVTFLVFCNQIGTVLAGMLEYIDYNPCPIGAEYYYDNDKCYVVRNKAVIWNIAERNCKNMGGLLAIIDDEYEQHLIESITGSYKYWIGPNDREKSRVYVNPDGTTPTYFKWDDTSNGQPNDDIVLNDQGCVCLTKAKYWHDEECYYPERYVCQLVEPRNFLQLTFIHLKELEFIDGDTFTFHTTISKIKCQVLCVSYQICIGYLWDTFAENDNCQLISPSIGSNLTAYPDEMMYEVVER
ncbi:hypothetical protein LOTGIDRAFT_169459 [Lottia gigantea]|uniref:C-type lectin domain-containing protein n=1 Tax=Lottia gigantea TaxID=225164 RepID=V3YZ30_LOTGI|nr:hypothetical protein LOTGIDRAFT_169459 [Lottia gigantea]ESO83388.1 hypothetical protein LOTGIDRAFT_169459 [Lottia gigantea]